ncbi:hypothetical protein A2U01_0040583, partial [Trifolium medium]|nr:hypothetical protein [Trifolium medium]
MPTTTTTTTTTTTKPMKCVTKDSQHHEVVDSEVDDTRSTMVSNISNPKVQSAFSTETYAPKIDVVSLVLITPMVSTINHVVTKWLKLTSVNQHKPTMRAHVPITVQRLK